MFVCYRMVQSWRNLAVGRRREEVGRPKLVVAKEWPRQIVITGEATAAEVPRFFQHTTAEPASWLVDLDHRGWVGFSNFKNWRFPYKQGNSGSSHVSICLPTELGLNTNPVPPVVGGWSTGIEDSGKYRRQETELVQALNSGHGSFVSIAQNLYPDYWIPKVIELNEAWFWALIHSRSLSNGCSWQKGILDNEISFEGLWDRLHFFS